jgi:hypothetical protein
VVRDRPTDIRLSKKETHRKPQAVTVGRAQPKPIFVPLTRRALYQRLARALARSGKTLRKARAAPARRHVGEYFILSDNDGIVAHHVDLQQLAREIGVLQTYEQLITED